MIKSECLFQEFKHWHCSPCSCRSCGACPSPSSLRRHQEWGGQHQCSRVAQSAGDPYLFLVVRQQHKGSALSSCCLSRSLLNALRLQLLYWCWRHWGRGQEDALNEVVHPHNWVPHTSLHQLHYYNRESSDNPKEESTLRKYTNLVSCSFNQYF